MTHFVPGLLPAAFLVALLPTAPAQSGRVGVVDAPLHVAIVGASVSAGFVDGPLGGGSSENSTVPLQRIVRAWLQDRAAAVTSRADMMMFLDAQGRGRAQIERTARAGPDLVLAIDFLFWFGYGRVQGGDEAKARLARLQEGLDLLARLECPLVVGDLPDMAGASARMISPGMIPPPAVLAQLNARLQQWAAGRKNVLAFPLHDLVASMKHEGVRLPLAGGELATPPGGLLQGDGLHANRLGMAWLGLRLQQALQGVQGPTWPELPSWTFAQFVGAAGAADELADLRASAGGAKKPPAPAAGR